MMEGWTGRRLAPQGAEAHFAGASTTLRWERAYGFMEQQEGQCES